MGSVTEQQKMVEGSIWLGMVKKSERRMADSTNLSFGAGLDG